MEGCLMEVSQVNPWVPIGCDFWLMATFVSILGSECVFFCWLFRSVPALRNTFKGRIRFQLHRLCAAARKWSLSSRVGRIEILSTGWNMDELPLCLNASQIHGINVACYPKGLSKSYGSFCIIWNFSFLNEKYWLQRLDHQNLGYTNEYNASW